MACVEGSNVLASCLCHTEEYTQTRAVDKILDPTSLFPSALALLECLGPLLVPSAVKIDSSIRF